MIARWDLFINSQMVRTDIPPSSVRQEIKRKNRTLHAYLSNEKVAFTRAEENTHSVYNDDQSSYNINLCHARAKTILI